MTETERGTEGRYEDVPPNVRAERKLVELEANAADSGSRFERGKAAGARAIMPLVYALTAEIERRDTERLEAMTELRRIMQHHLPPSTYFKAKALLLAVASVDATPEPRGGRMSMNKYIDVVFDGPPSHKAGRFVEVENEDGASIRAGEWIEREDGLWALRIERKDAALRENERLQALIAKAWEDGFVEGADGFAPDPDQPTEYARRALTRKGETDG